MENIKKSSNDYFKELSVRNVLDDFQLFMEYGSHKKERYTLNEIINEFISYIKEDLENNFPLEDMKNIKKHIRGICFSNKKFLLKLYGNNREEGEE